MNSGLAAETAVAAWLAARGYRLLERNWRTKSCELDIVAERRGVVYFVEVKYRRSSAFGDGFSYITAAKRRQLRYAARLWTELKRWKGEQRLLAAAVSGRQYESIEVVELE